MPLGQKALLSQRRKNGRRKPIAPAALGRHLTDRCHPSGCGWLGQLTADWPTLQRLPDRDLREPSSCGPLGRCFNQHQQGVDDSKTIAGERSRNEAGYLSHNPGAKAP